jgi:lipopolysaccharide biosynthesis protein
MGIEPPLPPFFEFPVGSMFWARPCALSPLLDLKLDWDDYPEEPIPDDGTILHALERLIPFSAGKVGLTWSTVHIPGVTR